jgi:hypothetical protein
MIDIRSSAEGRLLDPSPIYSALRIQPHSLRPDGHQTRLQLRLPVAAQLAETAS